jgi:hypothetical protein
MAGLARREPNGRKKRARFSQRGVDGPTPETLARRKDILGDRPGMTEDWIDIALANSADLGERQAEALRRYRALILAYRRAMQAPAPPAPGLDMLQSGLGKSGGPGAGAAQVARLREELDQARDALKPAPRPAAEDLERHIDGMAYPLPRALTRIASVSWLLVRHFRL